ncbi:conserved hypothetical protein [Cellulomonas flavigena DSM 20109]|uniref:Uncharacterized protein n=1 Tax=Cellulomonas flavigena (strain ATCC 482 / DSM 20109 / BCRC 11376 / JCM 18109 / NBRC 3775 / NCIMB 8073 / NRS 134) TaxID=446466 RepID=D5UJZ2_CELFN|nr:hypothetical protein [Cellulomonas flavigena]ADG73734.1 conserved hypothetical protein [Cellulomonas flavigena DSM 20109]
MPEHTAPHPSWVEHRRSGDRELLGWVRPEGDDFVAVDRLGRDVSGPVGWVEAEEVLDERGLLWLAGLWQLTRPGGSVVRVRLMEVSPRRVVVKVDDHNAVGGGPPPTYELPFPAPATLAPFEGDPHVVLTGEGV